MLPISLQSFLGHVYSYAPYTVSPLPILKFFPSYKPQLRTRIVETPTSLKSIGQSWHSGGSLNSFSLSPLSLAARLHNPWRALGLSQYDFEVGFSLLKIGNYEKKTKQTFFSNFWIKQITNWISYPLKASKYDFAISPCIGRVINSDIKMTEKIKVATFVYMLSIPAINSIDFLKPSEYHLPMWLCSLCSEFLRRII